MNKYVVLYYAPISALEMVQNATPEEMKAGMEPWIAWMARCGDALVDPGAPLGGGLNVSASGSSPSDKKVTGYSILQADNMEAAQALLEGHPHLGWMQGCEVEVHEAIQMPGQE